MKKKILVLSLISSIGFTVAMEGNNDYAMQEALRRRQAMRDARNAPPAQNNPNPAAVPAQAAPAPNNNNQAPYQPQPPVYHAPAQHQGVPTFTLTCNGHSLQMPRNLTPAEAHAQGTAFINAHRVPGNTQVSFNDVPAHLQGTVAGFAFNIFN